MSPRTPQQLKTFRAQKKLEIISKALVLFAENGYFNTSVSDIAKTVGMSKGLLYSYFESKEVLLNEVIAYSLREGAQMYMPKEELKGLHTQDIFKKAIEGYFDLLQEKKELWRLIVSVAIHVSSIPSVYNTITLVYEELLAQMEELFVLIGHENPKNEAIKLGAVFDGIGIQYLIFGKEYPLQQIKENILNTYLKK